VQISTNLRSFFSKLWEFINLVLSLILIFGFFVNKYQQFRLLFYNCCWRCCRQVIINWNSCGRVNKFFQFLYLIDHTYRQCSISRTRICRIHAKSGFFLLVYLKIVYLKLKCFLESNHYRGDSFYNNDIWWRLVRHCLGLVQHCSCL